MRDLRIKQRAAPPPGDDPFEFVMSDGSVDRMGDIIEPDAWELRNFKSNPVALFSHNPEFPIGTWQDVAVHRGQLTGRLELMEPVSERLRELHAAVNAGVLRAVSVGFHSRKFEPIEGSKVGGLRFLEAELVECSLVSVPANPNALAKAKALGISRDGLQAIFGVSADKDPKSSQREPRGVPAVGTHPPKATNMNQLSERIQDAQNDLVALTDQLQAVNPDDLTQYTDLSDRIEQARSQIAIWERAERNLAQSSEVVTVPSSRTTVLPPGTSPRAPMPKTWAQPKKEAVRNNGQFLMNALIAMAIAHEKHLQPEQALVERGWGDDVEVRACLEWMQRAASNAATTNTSTWAQELVQIQYGDFLAALPIASVYSPLSARGERITLGRFGQISLPVEQTTPTIAGSFVAEGAPIPVRQGAFGTFTLGLKKMAVITTFTRELYEHSNPTIDTLLRDMIGRHTIPAIDNILLDNNPATSVRPPGIRNGVSGQTPTAGGGFNALVGDIINLMNVLVAANSFRRPTWIMNPQQVLKISMTQSTAGVGVFPFKAEIDAGMLVGYPVISSPTVTAGMVILLDAADFVSLSGDDPRFEVSDQATLHMEDTTPLAIGTPGAPPTVAAPVRSLFQTDTLGLRMILPMNWAMRRTGLVSWVTGVTW
jgi:HK97 family phage major capsid protein/HK97 family phage prohead protease